MDDYCNPACLGHLFELVFIYAHQKKSKKYPKKRALVNR